MVVLSLPRQLPVTSLRTMAAAARALAEGLAEAGELGLALDADALASRIDAHARDDEPTREIPVTLPAPPEE